MPSPGVWFARRLLSEGLPDVVSPKFKTTETVFVTRSTVAQQSIGVTALFTASKSRRREFRARALGRLIIGVIAHCPALICSLVRFRDIQLSMALAQSMLS